MVPLVFYDSTHVPDDRPGAGELSSECFFEVRDRIVETCQRHSRTGPEDRPWESTTYWVVSDQYNDDRYQVVEVRARGMTTSWLQEMIATLQKLPHWGVCVNVPRGYMIIFGDRLMLQGPTFEGCKAIDEVTKRAAIALSIYQAVQSCADDVNVEALSKMPAVMQDPSWVGRLSLPRVSDAGLSFLARFPELRVLVLDDSAITDAGLAHLKPLTTLEELWLQCEQISDAGIAILPSLPRLRKMFLGGSKVSDSGYHALTRFGQLEEVSCNTLITDHGLKSLANLARSLACAATSAACKAGTARVSWRHPR